MYAIRSYYANWFEYSEPISNTTNYFPELTNIKDGTGYILDVDGKRTSIWVIDYQNYLRAFNSIEIESNFSEQCENLDITFDVKPLTYKTPSNTLYYLPRYFKVSYQTLEFIDSWNTINVDTTITLALPVSKISFPAPLCDTYYIISDDSIASQLKMEEVSFKSSLYNAVAVKCKLTPVITTRDAENENERPTTPKQLSISAPVEMQFLSNANDPTKFYNWTIYKGSDMIINRTDKDHRYTFTEAGVYNVKLTVSNDIACFYADSVTITVSESRIEVPNVFTPNGDEYNNEFRVAFKSIVKFDCWVYNRWGRLVYHWSDPTKGWDGKIGGKDAVPGPYFYVIKAYGSDYDPESEPNKETKRRVGEYILKGDINLLRGVK